jgi:hypothetical protein
MDGMRSWDRIRQSTFVGHVIMLVSGFMMTVAENSHDRIPSITQLTYTVGQWIICR